MHASTCTSTHITPNPREPPPPLPQSAHTHTHFVFGPWPPVIEIIGPRACVVPLFRAPHPLSCLCPHTQLPLCCTCVTPLVFQRSCRLQEILLPPRIEFSKVSALEIFLYKVTIECTFENAPMPPQISVASLRACHQRFLSTACVHSQKCSL